MKNKLFKRITSIAVCLALLISCIPMALISASATATTIEDDFEGNTINWTQNTASEPNVNSIIAIGEGEEANKVFHPVRTYVPENLGDSNIYTYNGTWPDRKMASVSGVIHAETVSTTFTGLVIVYYYKDADNWRGLCFTQEKTGQWDQNIRFCGKENGNKNDFASFGTHIYGGTLTTIVGLDTTFTITYNSDGTASMVLTNSTGTSPEIPLLTSAASFAGRVFENSVNANEGQFALANGGWVVEGEKDYFDDVVITFESTPEDAANAFKKSHEVILGKTVADVTAADVTAINAALADYNALGNAAKAHLEDEYALLNDLSEAIVAAQFSGDSFTENFGGEVYWQRVDSADDAASCITSEGAFKPAQGYLDAISNIKSIPVYTHKYWPEGKTLGTVSGDYTLAPQYHKGALIIYYYKDLNNWRGFYIQRAGAFNIFNVTKETDATDSTKVYYTLDSAAAIQLSASTTDWTDATIPAAGSTVRFTLTYDKNGAVKVVFTQGDISSKEVVLSDAINQTAVETKVSTDGGVTFADASEAHTVAAITDANVNQFAMGCGQGNCSVFDNITVTFTISDAEIAKGYKETHKDILSKTTETVTSADQVAIDAAKADYDALGENVKVLLAEQYKLLGDLSEAIVAAQFSGDSFTENFGGEVYWQRVDSADDAASCITDEGAFKPAQGYLDATTHIKSIPVYTHKYWPEGKTLATVSGDYTLAPQYHKGALIIYYYKDLNNWRGFYIQRAGAFNIFNVTKETDANDSTKVYYTLDSAAAIQLSASTTDWTDAIVPEPETTVRFTLTYDKNGAVKVVFTQGDISSKEVVLSDAINQTAVETKVSTDGGVTFADASEAHTVAAITDANVNQFAMGCGQGNCSVFDNITVTFATPVVEETTSAEFEAYASTYELTAQNVTYAAVENIDAAIALYEGLNDSQKATYKDNYDNLVAIKPVAEFDKSIRDIVVTPGSMAEIEKGEEDYAALGVANVSIASALAEKNNAIDGFRPGVLGGTIKTAQNPENQNLRFKYEAPVSEANGWSIVSYGAIFLPENMLNGELTVDTAEIAMVSVDLQEGEKVPDNFVANLSGSAISGKRCSRNIAGTAFVVWSNGTDSYYYYCNDEVDNSKYTSISHSAGVCVRSVYGIAREIAKVLHGQDTIDGGQEYGIVDVIYTTAITKESVLADCQDADVLVFVAANVNAVKAYVAVNQ